MRRQQKPNPKNQIQNENTKFIMISFNKDGKSEPVASQPEAKWSFLPGLALQKHSPDLVSEPDINKLQNVEYKNQNAKNKMHSRDLDSKPASQKCQKHCFT